MLYQFSAQIVHMHVHDAAQLIRREVPQMVEEILAGDNFMRASHEILEKTEFFQSERERVTIASRLLRCRIESERADAQDRRMRRTRTPPERSDAGEQLHESKRLHKVIVRATVEPKHPILNRVTGREHENGCHDAALSGIPAQRDAVLARQKKIEDDEVVIAMMDRKPPIRCQTVFLDVDCVALFFKRAGDRSRELRFVFNEQDAHMESLLSDDFGTARSLGRRCIYRCVSGCAYLDLERELIRSGAVYAVHIDSIVSRAGCAVKVDGT